MGSWPKAECTQGGSQEERFGGRKPRRRHPLDGIVLDVLTCGKEPGMKTTSLLWMHTHKNVPGLSFHCGREEACYGAQLLL